MKRHSKYPWTKIESVKDLQLYLAKRQRFDELDLTAYMNLEALYGKGSHHTPKGASAMMQRLKMSFPNASLLDLAGKLDEMRLEGLMAQIQKLHRGETIYINDFGGWNNIEGFLDDLDGEWIDDEVSPGKEFLKTGSSNILILENATSLPVSVKRRAEKLLGPQWKEKANIIFALDTIFTLPETTEFIQKLIKRENRLTLIFETTGLSSEMRQRLKSFAPFIEKIYTNRTEELAGFGIEIHPL